MLAHAPVQHKGLLVPAIRRAANCCLSLTPARGPLLGLFSVESCACSLAQPPRPTCALVLVAVASATSLMMLVRGARASHHHRRRHPRQRSHGVHRGLLYAPAAFPRRFAKKKKARFAPPPVHATPCLKCACSDWLQNLLLHSLALNCCNNGFWPKIPQPIPVAQGAQPPHLVATNVTVAILAQGTHSG